MSRNPYLAASRPTSSFTRSSRTSKRNDLSSGKGSYGLGRSRSSATLAGGMSSQMGTMSSYSLTSGYTPTSSTWQRSLSSTRPNTSSSDSYKAADYTPAYQRQQERTSKSSESPKPSICRSVSSHGVNYDVDADNDIESLKSDHLKNYQQSKLQPSQTRTRSSIQSLDSEDSAETKRSTTSIDSSGTELSYDDSESVTSGSAPRHLKQGQLLKSRSLDVGQQKPPDSSLMLSGSMSVDRLLLRSESMTERELRKSYKELVMENERLKRQLKGNDERDKQKLQDWIRKERQMQRKISELEEENRQLEQWKLETQRLQDENSSLIRVVSKLSKKN